MHLNKSFLDFYLDFECKIFLQILDDHYKKGQLDSQRFPRISRTSNICGANVSADNFKD